MQFLNSNNNNKTEESTVCDSKNVRKGDLKQFHCRELYVYTV